eukprot:ctg_2719.g591
MSAVGRCQGNCPRIVLSSALRSLVRLSVCVQRFQGVDAAAAIADDVVVEPAGCVCAMSTAALADSLREAVLARVALICLLNRADDSPGSVIDQWISDLNAAEEALTVGVLLLMERSPEADRPLALVERLYRASPERLTLRAQMRALACTSCVLPTQLRMLLRRLEESNDMEAASDGDGCAAADLQWWPWLAQHIRESLRTNGETDVFWRCCCCEYAHCYPLGLASPSQWPSPKCSTATRGAFSATLPIKQTMHSRRVYAWRRWKRARRTLPNAARTPAVMRSAVSGYAHCCVPSKSLTTSKPHGIFSPSPKRRP